MIRLVLLAVLLLLCQTAHAAEATAPVLLPRLTLIELQYPQGLAASAGAWLRLPERERFVLGVPGDVGVGLGGASVALGLGALSSDGVSYERGWSVGVQGVALRTWPWWSPWLPTAKTYAGAQVFAAYFAFRCSAGVLWPAASGAPSLMGGCGLGTP